MKDQRKGDAEKTEPGESTKSRDEEQNFQLDDEESEAIDSLYNEGDKEQEIDPSTGKPKRVVIDKEVDQSLSTFPIKVMKEATVAKGNR